MAGERRAGDGLSPPAPAEAELIADGGRRGSEESEFFRSPGYLQAERATHTLRIESPGGELAMPVIVRAIEPGGWIDAVSPYGYPGARVSGEPADPASVDWRASGLVSLFARERLAGRKALLGGRARSRVLLHDHRRPRHLRERFASQVRRAERRGWAVDAVEGPAVAAADRVGFGLLYRQTMDRAGASERYFFDDAYLSAALDFERAWLLSARRDRSSQGAASIAVVSDGVLHYFLGGTAAEALDESPFRLVVVAMCDLADRLELPLNLGGGLRPGDGLERFKRGFANSEREWLTHEIVCDSHAYAELVAGAERAPGFFPAYRAPPG